MSSNKRKVNKSDHSTRARAEATQKAIREPERAILGGRSPSRRSRWARLSFAEREKIAALLAITDNRREIARAVGVHPETVRRVESELEEIGELHRLRSEKRAAFVDKAWDCIMLGLQTIKDGLIKGYVCETARADGSVVELVSRVGPVEAARAVLALRKMVQIADAQPISIVEELAQSMTEDELNRELQRLEDQLAQEKGKFN